jgi:RNA polymerase sigma-70 factor (ECF subfamily)
MSLTRAPFQTTHWSLILAAGEKATPTAREALSTLCVRYWYPLYAFVRRSGHDRASAADLTQSFFTRLLEKDVLLAADRSRGRFRTFLIAALKNFIANEWDKERTAKRGGGVAPLPLDFGDAEAQFSREPSHELTPDRIFDRRWAITLLDGVLADLQRECATESKQEVFNVLKESLTGDAAPYAQLGQKLNMSESAVKVAVHRLRNRYRQMLRNRIAETVATPEDIEDEIRELFSSLRV